MKYEEFDNLVSKIIKPIIKLFSESIPGSVFFVLIVLFVIVPLTRKIWEVENNIKIDLNPAIISIGNFLEANVTLKDWLYITLFLLVISILIWLIYQMTKSRAFRDKFSHTLNCWDIPYGTEWKPFKNKEEFNSYALSVTNSDYPGTVKDLYGWYDYEAVFEAKIIENKSCETPNFSFVIRAENNLNGLMFQVGLKKIRPHFIYNGTFITDDENDTELPIILQTKEWIKVKVRVEGNLVILTINGYKSHYNIKTHVFGLVENKLLRNTVSLATIKKENDKMIAKITQLFDQDAKRVKMVEGPEKRQLEMTSETEWKSLPETSRLVLNYPKGSFGFRESGNEQAYFRNLVVTKI